MYVCDLDLNRIITFIPTLAYLLAAYPVTKGMAASPVKLDTATM